jgi:hypothetical protein
MFVGLGDEIKFYKNATFLNLFIGSRQANSTCLGYTYFGMYEVFRVESLEAEEWAALSESVRGCRRCILDCLSCDWLAQFQKEYIRLTQIKVKGSGTATEIRRRYDIGVSRVPCVRLICIRFNHALFDALKEPPRTRPGSAKKREYCYTSDDDARRPKKKRAKE